MRETMVDQIASRFISRNPIDVPSIVLTREQWNVLFKEIFEYRMKLVGVLGQFRKPGCTCAFPSGSCCSYAAAEQFLKDTQPEANRIPQQESQR